MLWQPSWDHEGKLPEVTVKYVAHFSHLSFNFVQGFFFCLKTGFNSIFILKCSFLWFLFLVLFELELWVIETELK